MWGTSHASRWMPDNYLSDGILVDVTIYGETEFNLFELLTGVWKANSITNFPQP